MEALRVRKYPEVVLRAVCKSVPRVTEKEKDFFRQMLVTMHYFKGIGLAASQVGIARRLMVADIGEGPIGLANPEIVRRKGTDVLTEGCLSLPNASVGVSRDYQIVVTGLNQEGKFVEMKAEGLLARVIQHEIDHLNGKLILDYLPFDERQKYDFVCEDGPNANV